MKSSSLIAFALLGACAAAQLVGFECQAVGPLPAPPAVNCDGLSGVGAEIVASTSPLNFCNSFPTQAAQCLRVSSDNPAGYIPSLAPGALVARPLPAGVPEARFPLPTGTTQIRYDWQAVLNDGLPYNDGFDISVCDAAGNRLWALNSGDVTNLGSHNDCVGVLGRHAILPSPTPAGAYLSISAFDTTDSCCGGTFVALDKLGVSVANDESFAAEPIGACVNGPFTNAGAPFFGTVGADGNSATSGPFGPGLSGVSIYTVLLDDVGNPGFTALPPQSYTIP